MNQRLFARVTGGLLTAAAAAVTLAIAGCSSDPASTCSSTLAADAGNEFLPIPHNDAGEAGTGSSDLGKACASDAECSGGLKCATSIAGGSPALGYCSIQCNQQIINTSAPDVCAPFGGVCDDFSPSTSSTPDAWCVELCPLGSVADPSTKCHGREEVACIAVQQDTGFCRPLCISDDQCAGKKCDPSSGLCMSSLQGTAGIGDHCTSGDAGASECPFCLSLIDSNDAGDQVTLASFCSARCRLGTQGACSFGNSTGPGDFCLFPGNGSAGVGDIGYCAELCDTNADCSDKQDGFICNTSTANQLGHGYCDLPNGSTPDAGPEASPGDASEAGSGDASDGGASEAAASDAASDAAGE